MIISGDAQSLINTDEHIGMMSNRETYSRASISPN